VAGDLGAAIRAARERRGLSQDELAVALNVSLRTVGNWERSETSPRGALARIVDLLGPLEEPPAGGLRAYADEELLAEIGRRLAIARTGSFAAVTQIHPTTDVGMLEVAENLPEDLAARRGTSRGQRMREQMDAEAEQADAPDPGE
jgi:transcriptional regulator with XRE-family HTH domain